MKNIKLTVYIFIELLLILMARLVFVNSGKIGALASEAGINTIAKPLQNLYVLQALILFLPFIFILVLIAMEIMATGKEKKVKQEEMADLQENEISEEELEEARKQQQELKNKEMEEKKQKLLQCIEEKFRKSSSEASSRSISENLLGCIAKVYEITQGEIFLVKPVGSSEKLVLSATFAFYVPEEKVYEFEIGEGLIGQVAKAGQPLYMNTLPQGYITVKSGLGESTPSHLLILPWKNQEGKTIAVLELASFKAFEAEDIELIAGLSEKVVDFYAEKI
jgi:preprotein translocase subunit SecG